MSDAIVPTTSGPVRGRIRDGVASFLGIPYAASPTGALRFHPPAPPTAWADPRDAFEFGPTPPKPPYAPPIDEILRESEVAGDDWLSVNVWTPSGAAGLPVLVWIYGGAFVNGNSTLPVYDGHAFARDGVVFVSLNYRLGVDGFAYIPDAAAPANRGLLDQVAALRWVRDNIALFGGDPANVTISGESAGAMSVTSLMVMPSADGLFAKAITQSGSIQAAASIDDAALVTGELCRELQIEPTAAALAAVDTAALITAQRSVSIALTLGPDPARFGRSIVASSMAYIPIVDGDTLPTHPMAAIAAGASASIPLLTGTTLEEHRLFLVPTGFAANVTDEMLAGMLVRRGAPPSVADVYRANRPGAMPGEVLCALLTDAFFRMPAFAVAQARTGAPTFMYEFAWRTSVFDLGACHALEIGFVFDNLRAEGNESVAGPKAPQQLADAMHAAWVAFARTGDPGWPALDATVPVMVFDGDGARVVHNPRGDERAAWSRPPRARVVAP